MCVKKYTKFCSLIMPGSHDASLLLGKEKPASNGCRGETGTNKG